MARITRRLPILATASLLTLSGFHAHATAVSANYAMAPSASGAEDTVASFNIYDVAVGAALIEQTAGATNSGTVLAPQVGDSLTGYYQSYITDHQLNGIVQTAPGLNQTGSGGGYELTLIAQFEEVITGTGASVTADIVGGTASILFDPSPDFDFIGDSGFTNGDVLLSGNITSGGALFSSGFGVGVTTLDIQISTVNTDVFDPDILSADGVFTLQINSAAASGVTSVMGHSYDIGSDLLLGADGNIELQAVPIPPAIWLFGSSLAMMLARRRISR